MWCNRYINTQSQTNPGSYPYNCGKLRDYSMTLIYEDVSSFASYVYVDWGRINIFCTGVGSGQVTFTFTTNYEGC